MTIIGKSKAAIAMLTDALISDNLLYTELKIYNNLNIEGDYYFRSKKISETSLLKDFQYVLGAVMPETKRKLVELFPLNYQTLINKTASVSQRSKIGTGCMIDGLAFIANGVTLGKYVTVYSSTISHDSILGDYVTICPGVSICGNVVIGNGAFIGAGSTISNGVIIGKNAIVGAGSVVLKDVSEGQTVYGNPAKPKVKEKVTA